MFTKPMNLFSLLLLGLLSGCSGTYNAYYQSFKLAINHPPDATVTLEKVRASKVDMMLVRNGERSQAIMALAFLEQGKHKWLSADNAMLVINHGRIVRTVGLKANLDAVTGVDQDPLQQPKNITNGAQWHRTIDWQGVRFNVPVDSVFEIHSGQNLTLFDHVIPVTIVDEKVTFACPGKVFKSCSWHNLFWYDPASFTLLKSRQQLFPDGDVTESTYVSQVARLIEGAL